MPDVRSNRLTITPLLIGTNTLDPLYDQFCDDSALQTSPYCGYHQVFRTLQIRHKQSSNGHFGLVNQKNSEPRVIPAGQKVVLEGYANVDNVTNDESVLEQPTVPSLPGGIFVDCCLINLPRDSPFKVPVALRNETDHDISLLGVSFANLVLSKRSCQPKTPLAAVLNSSPLARHTSSLVLATSHLTLVSHSLKNGKST